ncbi:hypothetical protein NEOLEDRAFT_1128177 [Neolentinus lepideus HHB14362 ss-1]|uniref:F-box domain-containing protein n=1 Tax=Neolentinus lepideus HHB14362 ss-1 TaxID=1314782 RepID=A0A165VAW0_9AGAM|nr:hypothetical protein NEOLEDRAFT_1128177 [Neolentinus lepideus HHB14362 ss-1]
MHRCLTLPEIVSAIAEHVPSDYSVSLAAFARTCKSFFEPSIAILWGKLPSIIPLLECLPQEYWAYDSGLHYASAIL